ncbi:hypothetical protein D3C80_888160 [compost metagenome]
MPRLKHGHWTYRAWGRKCAIEKRKTVTCRSACFGGPGNGKAGKFGLRTTTAAETRTERGSKSRWGRTWQKPSWSGRAWSRRPDRRLCQRWGSCSTGMSGTSSRRKHRALKKTTSTNWIACARRSLTRRSRSSARRSLPSTGTPAPRKHGQTGRSPCSRTFSPWPWSGALSSVTPAWRFAATKRRCATSTRPTKSGMRCTPKATRALRTPWTWPIWPASAQPTR